MRILFLSTSIPPYPDMQAIRNYYLINGLVSAGHSVTVVTSVFPWSSDSKLAREMRNICEMIETDSPTLMKIWRGSFSNNPFIKRILGVLLNKIASPDLHMGWDKMAIKTVDQLMCKSIGFDLIISSSGSHTAHMAASHIAKQNNMIWIAEYGDPWGIDKYGNPLAKEVKSERILLEPCKGLVMTTNETIDAYTKEMGLSCPTHHTPCGYDKVVEDKEDDIGLDILYTGVAYAGDRNLIPTIESVGCFPRKLKFRLVGDYSSKYLDFMTESLKKQVTFEKRVPYDKSIDYIAKAKLLVIVGNRGSLQIPGKTYIYLGTKKPILYIRQEETYDPTFQLLQNFPGVYYASNTKETIVQALHEVFDNYHTAKALAEKRSQSPELFDFSWETIGSNFAAFVEDIYTREHVPTLAKE